MLFSILTSLLCGVIIGLERKLKQKSAGFKTLALISLGSTLFTMIALALGNDPTRIISNIVTGIGFIGGGIIFKDRENHISGMTTAAVIWITSAIGILAGLGLNLQALVLSIAIALLMFFGQKLENKLFP